MIDEIVNPGVRIEPSLSFRLRQKFKRVTSNPFKNERYPLMVCTHHKTGTNWFRNIFEDIAFKFGLTFSARWYSSPDLSADIFFDHHSSLHNSNQHLKGVHIIRDPRDIVVSGYYYHLWTKEAWAHQPLNIFDGLSYQQKLNTVSKHEGLLLEIKRCHFLFERMSNWHYDDTRFMELKYEDVISNDVKSFEKIFRFFEWKDSIVQEMLYVVEQHSFKNATNRKVGEEKKGVHLRSGKPGEWADEFSNEHLQFFAETYPTLLSRLKYE